MSAVEAATLSTSEALTSYTGALLTKDDEQRCAQPVAWLPRHVAVG